LVTKTWQNFIAGEKPSEEETKRAQGYQITQAEEQEEGDTRIELGEQREYFEPTKQEEIVDHESELVQNDGKNVQESDEKFEKVNIKKKKFETKKLPKNKKLKEKRDKTDLK